MPKPPPRPVFFRAEGKSAGNCSKEKSTSQDEVDNQLRKRQLQSKGAAIVTVSRALRLILSRKSFLSSMRESNLPEVLL